MADNILKAIIDVQAPGVVATTDRVASSVSKAEQSLKRLTPASNQATGAMINLGRVVQDAPFGFLGIANNLNPLLESFQRLKQSTGTTSGALKALGSSLMGAGGLGFALSIVSAGVLLLTNGFMSFRKGASAAKKDADALADAIKSITKNTAEEAARVEGLVVFLKQGTASTLERTAAIKELQSIAPAYFGTLDTEKFSINQLTLSYDKYVASLRRSIEARVTEKQLADVIEKRLNLEKRLGVGDRTINTIVRNGRVEIESYNAIIEDLTVRTELQYELNKAKEEEYKLSQKLANLTPSGLRITQPKVKEISTPKLKIKPAEVEFDLRAALKKKVGLSDEEIPEVPVLKIAQTIDISATVKGMAEGKAKIAADLKEMQDGWSKTAGVLSSVLTPAITGMVEAIGKGENAFKAFGQAVGQILKAVITKMIETAILASILSLISGGASKGGVGFMKAFGSLLGGGSGFGGGSSIGSLGMGGGGQQVQFVLRGNDLYGSMSATQISQRRLQG